MAPPLPKPLPPAQARTSSTRPNGQPSPGTVGNTTGIITPKPSPNGAIENGKPTKLTDPPVAPETPKEAGLWSKAGPWVHGVLGVASFVPGLSVVTGGADAAIYTAEGNYLEAGLSAASMIPGGKVVTTAGKLVRGAAKLATGAHEAEEVVQAARLAKAAEEAAKAEQAAKELREAEEATKLRKAEEAEGKAAKKEDGGRSKGKGKLNCGQSGSYGELLKSTGENMFDRDHVPSKAALKRAARTLAARLGKKLSPEQLSSLDKAIEGDAAAIAIPKEDHKAGRTHGYKNTPEQIKADSEDLQGAAKKDAEQIQKNSKKMDPKCRKIYADWAAEIVKKTNEEYKQWLVDRIKDALKK